MLQKSFSISREIPVSTYLDHNQASALDPDYVLARIGFGIPSRSDKTIISTGLTPIGDQPAVEEVWISKNRVSSGYDNGLIWAEDDNCLFVAHYLDETEHDNLRDTSLFCYRKLLSFVNERNYPNLVRIWNYMPKMNDPEGKLERYKAFSVGRFNAFEETGFTDKDYSSACAVGNDGNTGVVYLLASRLSCNHFENPNQVSAYNYPSRYGPRSPSFARATLANSAAGPSYYISGTASIIGSETQHEGNLDMQLKVTFTNIHKLLEVAKAELGYLPTPSILKAYVRKPEDLEFVKNAIIREFGKDIGVLYVRGDICRKDLLVEIDGICDM